jgi:hypothetical protein
MAGRTYIDFDITLRAVGAEYEAHVSSETGSASNNFPLPFTERELDDFFSIFGGRRVRRMESPQLERTRAFGGRLYRAVFNDELDDLLASSLTQAGESGRGLRIRLDFDDAPDLVNIPWEYLYRPASDDFFALSNWTPIVRYLDVEARMPPAPIEPPLSILVMISDPVEYQGSLDVEREWERLQESLADLVADGQVQVHRLERATERELLRELRRNDHHIFHFVGHGEFNEEEQDGVLLLEDEHRRTKLVTGRALGTVLRDSRSMRLVVLNNCEGARASDSDPFAGAAQSLLQKGMPAVAAMQFEVTDNAAISFAHEFYAGLSDGYPADAALAEARKAIYQGATQYEFGSPVLYLSAEDGVIFDIGSRPTPVAVFDAELTLAEPRAEAPQAQDLQAEKPAVAEPRDAVEVAAPVTVETPPEVVAAETKEFRPIAEQPVTTEPVAVPEAATVEMEPARRDPPGDSGNRKALYAMAASIAALVVIVIAFVATRDNETTATTAPQGLGTTAAGATGVGAVSPVDPQEGAPPTMADFTGVPPILDASDSEWTSRFFYPSQFKVFGADEIEDDSDLWADWRVAWDSEFLYLYVEVDDDVLAQVNTGANLFEGDAVAIYFDGDRSDDVPNAQLSDDDVAFFIAPDEAGQNWVKLVPSASGGGFAAAEAVTFDPEVRVASAVFDGGYDIEARIPWRLLGVTDPVAGQQFRMTLDVSDNDTPGLSHQDALRSNSGSRTAEGQAFPAAWEEMILEG